MKRIEYFLSRLICLETQTTRRNPSGIDLESSKVIQGYHKNEYHVSYQGYQGLGFFLKISSQDVYIHIYIYIQRERERERGQRRGLLEGCQRVIGDLQKPSSSDPFVRRHNYLENIFTHIHTYIHTHIHIYIYI